jgi:hypothetical protein
MPLGTQYTMRVRQGLASDVGGIIINTGNGLQFQQFLYNEQQGPNDIYWSGITVKVEY